MLRDDLLHLLKLEVVHVADQSLILTCDRTIGIHDGAGLVQFRLDRINKLVRLLRNDGHLLDRFEVIGKVVDDRRRDEEYEKTEQRGIPVDEDKGRTIDACVESDQDTYGR